MYNWLKYKCFVQNRKIWIKSWRVSDWHTRWCVVLCAVLYYKTNSLIITTLVHMIWNVCSFFNYAYVELNAKNSVTFLFIYATAVRVLFILLKESFIKVPRGTIATDDDC